MLRRAWHTLRARLAPAALGRGCVVEIFSKPDCHLCDLAKAELLRLQQKWRFELREVDITKEERLLAEFGERIPLVWLNGQLLCKYRIDEKALRQKLERAAGVAGEE